MSGGRHKMNSNLKKDFEQQFGAKIEPGTRRFFRRPGPASWSNFNADYNVTVEDIPSLVIHISEEEFEHMTQYMPGRIAKERRLREDVPAIQKAWDNYQLLLKMCGGDYI
jgi:hypothetical protein